MILSRTMLLRSWGLKGLITLIMRMQDSFRQLKFFDELLRLTLMSLEERKASGKEGDSESRSAVKVSKITYSGFESLLKDFLNECTDMKNIDLNQWVTVEDREVLYHYHKLSKNNKQLLLSILRILAISDKN